MTQHPDNAKRGERAAVSLKAHPMCMGEDNLDIRDLLTDLHHYCDTHGLDLDDEYRVAYDNYVLEKHDPCL